MAEERKVLFKITNLKQYFPLKQKGLYVKANDGIDGVFTAGTDFSASVAKVAEELSLPGHSYEAALNASNKTRMRQCFKNAGVPSPEFFSVTKENCAQFLNDCSKFPLVVKPVDNMGGRGCKLVYNKADLEQEGFHPSSSKLTINKF